MPLTESAKRKIFGNTEPQERRDYSGTNSAMVYEGFATPGISEDTAGWVIVKHTVDVNGLDVETQPKLGLIWTLRAVYNYSTP